MVSKIFIFLNNPNVRILQYMVFLYVGMYVHTSSIVNNVADNNFHQITTIVCIFSIRYFFNRLQLFIRFSGQVFETYLSEEVSFEK